MFMLMLMTMLVHIALALAIAVAVGVVAADDMMELMQMPMWMLQSMLMPTPMLWCGCFGWCGVCVWSTWFMVHVVPVVHCAWSRVTIETISKGSCEMHSVLNIV